MFVSSGKGYLVTSQYENEAGETARLCGTNSLACCGVARPVLGLRAVFVSGGKNQQRISTRVKLGNRWCGTNSLACWVSRDLY